MDNKLVSPYDGSPIGLEKRVKNLEELIGQLQRTVGMMGTFFEMNRRFFQAIPVVEAKKVDTIVEPIPPKETEERK